MLKKLRRRLIFSAMAAVLLVFCILLTAINVSNLSLVNKRLDATLSAILEDDFHGAPPFGNKILPEEGFTGRPPSPEARYMTRFFIVDCDADGQVLRVYTDFIASISEADAAEYAEKVLKKGKTTGYYGDYRYLVYQEGEDTKLAFLNAANDLQFMETLLFVSSTVTLGCAAVIFLLLILFSKRALSPYLKNIERQKQFITDAGHELKTPITSITTSAAVLAMDHAGNEWVENIQKQTQRMSRLVANLVTLSRLDEEAPLPEKQDFSLSDAAWETADAFAGLAEAQGKSYTQQIENDLFLQGDRTLIQQMLSILLDNAIRYSETGGQIQLNVLRKHRNMLIQVYNSCEPEGLGELERLFDRFYRPDRSRSSHTGGTGIGLSIAKAIAEAHGGCISVQAVEQKGLLFLVSLPA